MNHQENVAGVTNFENEKVFELIDFYYRIPS